MKLYQFIPQDYGEIYYVMSESPNEAKKSLLDYLIKEYEKRINSEQKFLHETITKHFMFWKEPLSRNELPEEYELKEYDENEIIEGEYF